MFGQFIDRYATDAYGPPVGTLEIIERAGRVGDLVALDLNYPFDGPDVTLDQVRSALDRAHLRATALTPVIVSRRFRAGSFTHPDAAVRRAAIDLVNRAAEATQALGADYVKLWPGQDGFDYPFQADYMRLWEYSVAGVREVAAANPSLQFAIEYKHKEPRTHMFFSSAARTLLAIEDMGVENVGLVVDLGHSIYAKETPAEVVQLVSRRGKLVSVELNDNWREWDDDLAVGSVHLIETLEFLEALRTIGWEKPLLLDQFPFREDPVEAGRASIRTIRRLSALLDRLDGAVLAAARDRQDALAAQRIAQALLLGGE
jgi:xylose isomerase